MKHAIIVSAEDLEKKIFLIRGQKVMLDVHLAKLYGVSTKRLKQQVRRNQQRFPNDFLFELTAEELAGLRLQFATSKTVRGGTRYMPFAFTEQGVAMLSTVLKSERAIQTNIAIMRAFVKIREFLSSHRELARKLEDLERKYESHDHKINAVFEAIRQLMAPPTKPKRRIGF